MKKLFIVFSIIFFHSFYGMAQFSNDKNWDAGSPELRLFQNDKPKCFFIKAYSPVHILNE